MKTADERDVALLDIKLLRLLDVLYGTRSVTKAADLLGQSQPTVSIWLAKLRRTLHDPLFVRTPTGMQPTPGADALVATAREALDALRRLSDWTPKFEPATSQRRFGICVTDATHVTLLPQLLAELRRLAPDVRLQALNIDARTAQALQDGEADLALGFIPGLDAGFYQQTLFPQDWICLVNPHHPRIDRRLGRRAYEREGHVGIVAGTAQHLLDTALQQLQVERRVLLELPGFLGLGAAVAATDLIATLPRNIGENLALANGLKVLPCPIEVPGFQVKQHWHARYHHDAANRWLRGVCARLFTFATSPPIAPVAPVAPQRR